MVSSLRRLLAGLVLAAVLSPLRAVEPPVDTPELQAALALYRERKDAEAETAYEKILAAQPTCDAAHYYLGRLARRKKAWKEVAEHLEECTKLKPDFGQYWEELGEAYGRRWFIPINPGRSRRALEKAIELEPANINFRKGLIEYHLRAPFPLGRTEQAKVQAEAIGKIDRGEGALALGRIELHEGNLDAAEKAFRSAATLQPDNADTAAELARVTLQRGRASEAKTKLAEILAAHPEHPTGLFYFARAALVTGEDLPQAETYLRRYLAQSQHPPMLPTHGDTWAILGQIMEARGEIDQARAAYEESLKFQPGNDPAEAGLKRVGKKDKDAARKASAP